jgi:hypothetical protein
MKKYCLNCRRNVRQKVKKFSDKIKNKKIKGLNDRVTKLSDNVGRGGEV